MSSPTDTNQANELFELCKEVYKRTKLDGTQFYYHENDSIDFETRSFKRNGTYAVVERRRADYDIPLYTSDYLLEKLQSWFYVMGANDFGQFGVTMLADGCIAKVSSHDKEFLEQASADTLLLALLKLTIALSEAGELK